MKPDFDGMTLDALRDWVARENGWSVEYEWVENICAGPSGWRHSDGRILADHPVPPTLDAANAAMPEGWDWYKLDDVWVARFSEPTGPTAEGGFGTVEAPNTGDNARGLFCLACKCRERNCLMPNFPTNDRDRKTAAALKKAWAAQRKEQGTNKALTDEQIDYVLANGVQFSSYSEASHRVWEFLETIRVLRNRVKQAEGDRKLIAGYFEATAGNIMESRGHLREAWKLSASKELIEAVGRAK